MDTGNIVYFKPARQLLEAARSCLHTVPGDSADASAGTVSLLIKAFKYADEDLKSSIIHRLGSFKKPSESIARHLYHIIVDSDEVPSIGNEAARQLSTVMSRLEDQQPLLMQLLEDVQHKHFHRRAGAALALGWENNLRAIPALIELLFDEEISVQQNAVKALCRIQNNNLVPLLTDRLRYASPRVRKTIMEHLCFFQNVRRSDEGS